MRYFAIALSCMVFPVAGWTASIDETLHNYVVAFDGNALNDGTRTKLRHIIEDNSMSHASKVLHVHTVLERNNALKHVDIHGARLDAPVQGRSVSQ